MILLLLAILLPLGVTVLYLITYLKRRRCYHIAHIPLPCSPKWIMGHVGTIGQKAKLVGFNLTAIMEAIRADLAGADTITVFYPGPKPPLIYSVRHGFYSRVLSDHRTFMKGKEAALGWLDGNRILGKHGLAQEPGTPIWYHKRREMDPAFKKSALRSHMDRINRAATKMCTHLQESETRECIDVFPVAMRTALEIAATCGFNFPHADFITKEDSPLNTAVAEIFRIGSIKVFNPISFALPWKFRKEKAIVKKQATFLRGNVTSHLQERFDAIAAGTDTSNDMLSHVIRANISHEALGIEDVLDDFLVFLIAAMETSAITVSFLIWQLLKDPELHKRVFGEVTEAFAGKDELQFEDLGKLALLEQCIKETLRMHPPSQQSFRVSPEYETTVDGIPIPPDCRLLISFQQVHNNPAFWEQPGRFDPARFDTNKTVQPFTWMPFGAGPRTCIGRHFALMEAKVLVATLLHRINLLDPYPEESVLEKETALFARPKKGVFVKIAD